MVYNTHIFRHLFTVRDRYVPALSPKPALAYSAEPSHTNCVFRVSFTASLSGEMTFQIRSTLRYCQLIAVHIGSNGNYLNTLSSPSTPAVYEAPDIIHNV